MSTVYRVALTAEHGLDGTHQRVLHALRRRQGFQTPGQMNTTEV